MTITVSAGRTRIAVSSLDCDQNFPAACRLQFQFDWVAGLEGAEARLELVHGAIVKASVSLPRFGPAFIDVIIRGLDPSHEILCDLDLVSVPDGFPVNSDIGVHGAGTLRLHSLAEVPDLMGARAHMAWSARDTCERMGLRGVYMRHDRREAFVSRILSAIEEKRPYSVVRLGDGEGRILGAGDTFSAEEVLTQVLYYHFGPKSVEVKRERDPNWVLSASTSIRDMLTQACESADELGLPVWDFFRGLEDGCTSGMVAYSEALSYALGLTPYTPDSDRIGTNVFQQLAETPDFFKAVAERAEQLVLVGPWDLTSQLSKVLQPRQMQYVEVPQHHTWGEAAGYGQYPFLYSAVEKHIQSMGDMRGAVFLIGAGLYGKHYAHLAKAQGAVALDIGSVFDSWGGKGLPYAVKNPRLGLEKLR